ncbi:MAG: sialidase family protein [Candidatus Thermoplasmatota archaeon]
MPRFTFAPPSVVQELGYEPGLRVAPDGTLFMHAHKSTVAGDAGMMASYLWWSRDAGETWTPVTSPNGLREATYAFEGDIAFDGAGHVFFLDNTLADQVVSRWRLTEEGPIWESTVPLAGTDGADDRPWLEASGDGQLVLMSKNPLLPGPGDLAGGRTDLGSYRVYRSTDAGLTWTLGATFAGSNWCDLAMDPRNPDRLAALCMDEVLFMDTIPAMSLHASTDGGVSWTTTPLGSLATGMADRFPSLTTTPSGTTLAVWIDDDPEDTANARLQLARSQASGTLEVLDATPFEGTFQRPWVCSGKDVAAIVFYGTSDVVPGDQSEWHVYAALSSDFDAGVPHWTLAQVDPLPVSARAGSPADFFQCAVAADGAVHIAYLRESVDPLPVGVTYGGTILHVRQATGPNLATPA